MVIRVFYFGVLGFVALFGLTSFLAPKIAEKIWRAWTDMPRILRPDIDWDRYMQPIPPRVVGLMLFAGAAWMIYLPLAHMKSEPVATITFGGGETVPHAHWVSAVFALAFTGLSIWMLVDPIGMSCFFRRMDRSEFPRDYKHGMPVILLAATFLLVGVLLLISVLRG